MKNNRIEAIVLRIIRNNFFIINRLIIFEVACREVQRSICNAKITLIFKDGNNYFRDRIFLR